MISFPCSRQNTSSSILNQLESLILDSDFFKAFVLLLSTTTTFKEKKLLKQIEIATL